MALKFTNQPGRKGELGDTNAGWSEQEFATPVSPAESAGGTGIVSLSGGVRDESLLLIGNSTSVEHVDDNSLGTVSGVVKTVSQAGLTASLTQDNKLAKYDVDATIPPISAASVPVALRLASQILDGDSGFNGTSGYFWSLDGHEVGFDSDAARIVPEAIAQTYTYYDVPTATFLQSSPVINYTGTLNASGYSVIGDKIYSTGVVGDSFQLGAGYVPTFGDIPALIASAFRNKFILQGKVKLNGQDCVISLNGLPQGPADGDYSQQISATIDYSAETISVSVNCRSGGALVNYSDTQSIAGLDIDAEIAFRFYWTYADISFPSRINYSTSLSVCNTSDYSTIVAASLGNYAADQPPLWFDKWTIAGNTRALWYRFGEEGSSNLVTWPLAERQDWEVDPTTTIVVSGTEEAGEPALGFTGNVWQYLQNACTAYGWEIGLEGDEITTRPVGGRILSIDNYSPTPTATPTNTFAGRQVDVVYTGASIAASGELYDARADDNRIISVGAGETNTVIVGSENVFPIVVAPPVRTTTFVPGQGTYYVVDSTGLPIVANQWEDYGGSVSVALVPGVANGIEVTVLGPREEIPSTTGPYSLAVSDGVNQYGALSILGSGVVADPKTLNLLTGADESKTFQQIATTINNPFIATLEQAYDSGIWASLDASGPRVTLSIVIPTNALSGFGITAGSIVEWGELYYRVVSATVGSIGVTLECVRHTTVADFDANWSGFTVAQHDSTWVNYIAEDQRILALKGGNL